MGDSPELLELEVPTFTRNGEASLEGWNVLHFDNEEFACYHAAVFEGSP